MDAEPMRTGPTLEGLKRVYPDVAEDVLAKLPDLYARCAAHFGPALDVAEVIRRYTQASRFRLSSAPPEGFRTGVHRTMLDPDELDAIVHAAEHGYEMCLRCLGYNSYCWLPRDHDGKCVKDNWYSWRLLFGQPASGVAVMEPEEAAKAFNSAHQYRFPGLQERPVPSQPAPYRIVLCMERHEAEVLERPHGLRVELIPWGRLAEDPETDPDAMELLNEALDAGEIDRALELARALTDEPDDGHDEDPRAWLGPRR